MTFFPHWNKKQKQIHSIPHHNSKITVQNLSENLKIKNTKLNCKQFGLQFNELWALTSYFGNGYKSLKAREKKVNEKEEDHSGIVDLGKQNKQASWVV